MSQEQGNRSLAEGTTTPIIPGNIPPMVIHARMKTILNDRRRACLSDALLFVAHTRLSAISSWSCLAISRLTRDRFICFYIKPTLMFHFKATDLLFNYENTPLQQNVRLKQMSSTPLFSLAFWVLK